jgi:hypothetical protein
VSTARHAGYGCQTVWALNCGGLFLVKH